MDKSLLRIMLYVLLCGIVIGAAVTFGIMKGRPADSSARLEQLVLDSMTYSANMEAVEVQKAEMRQRIAELSRKGDSLTLALGHADQNRRNHPPRSANADTLRARILAQAGIYRKP